jgi:hypothetical protein
MDTLGQRLKRMREEAPLECAKRLMQTIEYDLSRAARACMNEYTKRLADVEHEEVIDELGTICAEWGLKFAAEKRLDGFWYATWRWEGGSKSKKIKQEPKD